MATPFEHAPGGRLRVARKAAGLTQARLAERLGTVPQFISDVEVGRRNPSLEWLWEAAAAIGCDPSGLDDRLSKRANR